MRRSDPEVLRRVLMRSLMATVSNARVTVYAAGSLMEGRVGALFERRLSRELAAGMRAQKQRWVRANRGEFFH